MYAENHIPKYAKHKAFGKAVVRIGGRDYYLGPHGSKASRVEYDRMIALRLANGKHLADADAGITIVELIACFLSDHAERTCVRPDGSHTSELANYKMALKPLNELHGPTPVAKFGPLAL